MINKNRKNIIMRSFTLIEVLAAMAVFMILVSVMMQFFTTARNLWLTSSRRTDLYANARIALDMMARDLQCALYNNDNSAQGIYPFWFREYNQNSGGNVDELNFITSTDLKSIDANSNICEVRYTYVKTEGTDVTDDTASTNDIPVGWLVRSCVGDNNGDYDFMNYPFSTSGASRMDDIWKDSNKYKKVIPGVISLDFTCYTDSSTVLTAMSGSDKYGTPFPKIVKITIVLMDPDSWAKYNKIIGEDAIGAAMIKRSASRTFSRTIYLEQ
jgi:type II secretory pathway pseudopilin PulG